MNRILGDKFLDDKFFKRPVANTVVDVLVLACLVALLLPVPDWIFWLSRTFSWIWGIYYIVCLAYPLLMVGILIDQNEINKQSLSEISSYSAKRKLIDYTFSILCVVLLFATQSYVLGGVVLIGYFLKITIENIIKYQVNYRLKEKLKNL